jgi:hypothetical protein
MAVASFCIDLGLVRFCIDLGLNGAYSPRASSLVFTWDEISVSALQRRAASSLASGQRACPPRPGGTAVMHALNAGLACAQAVPGLLRALRKPARVRRGIICPSGPRSPPCELASSGRTSSIASPMKAPLPAISQADQARRAIRAVRQSTAQGAGYDGDVGRVDRQ